MRIAVAGATGVVGRHVLDVLAAQGDEIAPLSRATGVDLVSGTGLAAAVDGADAVIDVSNVTTSRRSASVAFFTATTQRLVDLGIPVVALSIVGVDRTPLGYYAGKLAQEEILLGCGHTTVLRATQFHEFPAQLVARGFGPLVPCPRMRSQPIAAREVAAALVSLIAADPAGRVPDLAGPRVEDMIALVRRVARGKLVVPITVPGAAGRAMTGDGLLPIGDGPRGIQTFDEWFAAQS